MFSTVNERLSATSESSSPAATSGLHPDSEPIVGQDGDSGIFFPLEYSFSTTHPNPGLDHQNEPSGDFSHSQQHIPYVQPALKSPTPALSHLSSSDLPAMKPTSQIQDQVMRLPEGINLHPVGFLNGEMVYGVAGPSSPAAQATVEITKKQEAQEQPYVKRPPNAFMLYLKEQRPNVVAELKITNNAIVNATLGQRWNSMTSKEQSKYYDQAEATRRLHTQQQSDSKAKENYVHDQVMKLPEGINLHPVGFLNGEMVYGIASPSAVAAPQSTSKITKKREAQDRPYVKRPPNAFMLYLKEQRPNIVAELRTTNNAVVNAALGQRWNSMSSKEQSKYYDQAEAARRCHSQLHPDWTAKENYGKRRYKKRSKSTVPG